MAAAAYLCSLMLNPSGVRLVLAQLALGTATGLTVMVAATGFLAYPTLALLPACCLAVAFATCSSPPARALSRSPRSGGAGDGWCWGTFVSYQAIEASLWSLAAFFTYEIAGLQRANPERNISAGD